MSLINTCLDSQPILLRSALCQAIRPASPLGHFCTTMFPTQNISNMEADGRSVRFYQTIIHRLVTSAWFTSRKNHFTIFRQNAIINKRKSEISKELGYAIQNMVLGTSDPKHIYVISSD